MPDMNISSVALGNHPIQIPSEFPGILKQYTKAAIRTQPRDLLLWSAAYFRCLARGEPPPAKDRLEYPQPETETEDVTSPCVKLRLPVSAECQNNRGDRTPVHRKYMPSLTPGLLRVIHKQMGTNSKVTVVTLSEKWRGVCLNQQDLDHLLLDGGWKRGEVDWLKFVGLATMTISDGIQNTMKSVCEILSDSPDGISANIKFETFREIYSYLAERNVDTDMAGTEAVIQYMEKVAGKQNGLVNPANIRAPDCPKM